MAYLHEPKNPVRDVLEAMTSAKPPDFVNGYDFSDLSDEELSELQDWCVASVKPWYLTGIGLLEAAEKQVLTAIENGNIPDKPKKAIL